MAITMRPSQALRLWQQVLLAEVRDDAPDLTTRQMAIPEKATGRPSAGRPNIPLLKPRVIHRETTRSPAAFVKTSTCSLAASPTVACIPATQDLNASRPEITTPAVVMR